jgi:hypothetical protein
MENRKIGRTETMENRDHGKDLDPGAASAECFTLRKGGAPMAHCSLRPKPSAVALVILGAAPSALNGQVVHGRVLDFDTDAPLATATVTILEGEDGGRRLGTAISAADGRFRLRAPGTGTYAS